MAAINQKIDVYKWNKVIYDEENIYSETTGLTFDGLQGRYGNGYQSGFDVEYKFQITSLASAFNVVEGYISGFTYNPLEFGIIISGGQPYWRLQYSTSESSSYSVYVSSTIADTDKHIFKVTKDGKYYLDDTLLVDFIHYGMNSGTIRVFNGGVMKLFYAKYKHFTGTYNSGTQRTTWSDTSDYTILYSPYEYNSTYHYGCIKLTRTDSSYTTNIYATGSGHVYAEVNSESLDFAAELTNSHFESVKCTEALSVLGDELVYDTLEVISKEEVSSTTTLNSIIYNGSQYALFDEDMILLGTNMMFRIRFKLTDLETAWQGIIGFSYKFIVAYAGIAFNHRFYVYYIDEDGVSRGNYILTVYPDNEFHVLKYENGVLTYDDTTILSGITLEDGIGATASVGKGILKSSAYPESNFIGEISSVYANNKNGTNVYNAAPYTYNGSYCFRSSHSGTYRYYVSKSGVEFNASLDTDISFSDDLENFPYGSVMQHYVDNVLIGKFYVEKSTRTGVRKYDYDCISAIGLLDKQYYAGNLFHGENFVLVVNEIMQGSGVTYSFDADIANVAVYGWIQYGTKRDALRQLLFATNAHVFKDSNQNVIFKYLNLSQQLEIPGDRVFDKGSIEYPKLATKISVSEHAFYSLGTEETVVLYDNTQGLAVNGLLVQFSEAPIILSTFATTGTLVIESASVNHAVVSGQGTLTGKPYTHVTQNIVRTDAEALDREEYEVTVTDATLVTAVNSENVADRVADYYFHQYIAKADIYVEDEKCGFAYTFTNAFNEESTGIMAKMQKVFSSFIRASCEFICGLSGTGGDGNNYTNYALITSSGTWTVPAGVSKIRATLIGGGQGGSSGLKGNSGNGKKGGIGGAAGIPGQAGKVYVVTLDVEEDDELTITIGAGGSGGAACSSVSTVNAGANGSSTSIQRGTKTYYSGSGVSSLNGVVNIFTDDVYALPGNAGCAGGNGGNGGSGGMGSGEGGSPGDSVAFGDTFHPGGTGGAMASINSMLGEHYQAGGGGASGASATANGNAGSAGTAVRSYYDEDPMLTEAHYETTGGAGGAGVSGGTRSAATVYGSGGDAGHGGSGAGGHGTGASHYVSSGYEHIYVELCSDLSYQVADAEGGNGGSGGNGAAGCVLIYY